MQRKDNKGFTLIELLIVVAIISVLGTIGIPSLLRNRMAANEAAAIASLRIINSAQATYAAICGNGFYAPTLIALGTPPTVGGGDGFIGPDLGASVTPTKSSYTFTMTAGAAAAGAPETCNGTAEGNALVTYFVAGAPTEGGGVRYFATNQGGTIYRSTAAIAVTQNGQPAGADPIQ